ncbi:MAG: LLM class flavin-dependent oxidoreductase [Bacteroidota bacterium]
MNSKNITGLTYSVLDLATVIEGKTPADTFKKSVDLARHAEEWGYERYWFAEHHNMASVASSATSLLIGHIAEKTVKIRVGAGGIMLPNHSPLIIAEQFGTLATLYPDRIDLGLGRAPGTDQLTALAIRGERFNVQNDFPLDVRKLQQFLSKDNSHNKVRAIPGEGTEVPIWILGSSTDSAYLAAAYGLPYAFASHFAPQQLLNAIQIYRANFKPSAQLQSPYVIACVNVVAADNDDEAERLSTSLKQLFMGIVTGQRKLLQPPVNDMSLIWNEMEAEAVYQMLAVSFIGGPAKIKMEMESFLAQTQVNEVMATSHIYDHQARLRSYQLFGEILQ